MSKKVLKAENFVADGICVMKEEPQGIWQVASVNQWVRNGNELAELFASAPQLKADLVFINDEYHKCKNSLEASRLANSTFKDENSALREALKDTNVYLKWLKSIGSAYPSVRIEENERIIAEAIQGDE